MSKYECEKDAYIFLRKFIKDGDILGASSDKIIGRFIKWFTKGKGDFINNKKCEMNHVGMFLWVRNKLFIMEANWSFVGAKKVELARFSKEYKKYKGRLFIIRPFESNKNIYLDKMLSIVGDPYDLEAAIRQVNKNAKYKLDKKQYCSEAINFSRNWSYTDGKLKHIKPHELVMKEPNFKFEISRGSIV